MVKATFISMNYADKVDNLRIGRTQVTKTYTRWAKT